MPVHREILEEGTHLSRAQVTAAGITGDVIAATSIERRIEEGVRSFEGHRGSIWTACCGRMLSWKERVQGLVRVDVKRASVLNEGRSHVKTQS